MPTYSVRNPKAEEQRFTSAADACEALQDGGVILRRWRKHWYMQLDRSWQGGGFTYVRSGYGGLIEESLADAKARFLRNELHFAPIGD